MPPIEINGQTVSDVVVNGQSVDEVTANGQTVHTAIPDSAVRHWPFLERENGTITERLADDDGTVVGNPTNTQDSTFFENYYEDVDGADDGVGLPAGAFETQLQSENYGFAFSFRLSNFTDGEVFFGKFNDSDNWCFLQEGSSQGPSGSVRLLVRQGDNDARVYDNVGGWDDGEPHRLFVYCPTGSPTDWEIWVDGEERNTQLDRDESGFDQSALTLNGDYIGVGAQLDSGDNFRAGEDIDVDNTILFDSPPTNDIEEDYNAQPFA